MPAPSSRHREAPAFPRWRTLQENRWKTVLFLGGAAQCWAVPVVRASAELAGADSFIVRKLVGRSLSVRRFAAKAGAPLNSIDLRPVRTGQTVRCGRDRRPVGDR